MCEKCGYPDRWREKRKHTYRCVCVDCENRVRAAAYDLLAALVRFTEAAESRHKFHYGTREFRCDELCAAIAPARAALLKAGYVDLGNLAPEAGPQ